RDVARGAPGGARSGWAPPPPRQTARIPRARTTLCARGVVTKPTGRGAASSVRTPRTTSRAGMIATNTCARWATRGHANILEVVEHHGHRSTQSEDQGVHVRPVRDRRRHAEGPDG